MIGTVANCPTCGAPITIEAPRPSVPPTSSYAAPRPYVPPTSNSRSGTLPGRGVSPRILDIMSRTKGWVRFIAVMLFINFGLSIFNIIMSFNAPRRVYSDSQGVSQVVSIFVILLLQLYPAVKLNSYATRIGALLQSASAGDLDAALNEHRGFWRYVGIIAIVLISFMVLGFFFAMAFASRW